MKIAKTVLSEQIKEQLMDDILDGKYVPGDRLVESALSRQYGVSQSPVREALKGLEEMGIVTQEPYKGTSVREISPEEAYEALTVRAALESIAAGLAAKNRTPEDIRVLEDALWRMGTTAQAGDLAEALRANKLFHQEIMRISGHRLIIKLSRTLRFASWSHMTGSTLAAEDYVRMSRRHRSILDAIIAGDPQAAEAAMRRHIEENIPELLKTLEQKNQWNRITKPPALGAEN